jgi:hypothetical protein
VDYTTSDSGHPSTDALTTPGKYQSLLSFIPQPSVIIPNGIDMVSIPTAAQALVIVYNLPGKATHQLEHL